MEAYFDNAATTRVAPEVAEVIMQTMIKDYGNPSSLHIKGMEADAYVKHAAEVLAKELKADEKELVFTSGGTESNNLAVIGAALANQRNGKKIVTSAIEHASVSAAADYLSELGFQVVTIGADKQGHVDLDTLKQAVDTDTILVSVMYVNNELGSVQPVAEIAKLIKEQNPKTLFHVDAVQAFGKYRIYPKRTGIDLMSISAHKIHGPKGVGALFVRDRVKIKPLFYGGGQQTGIRSGTENVPGIAGLSVAAKLACSDMEEKMAYVAHLKEQLIRGLTAFENVESHSGEAPHIASITFHGVRSEVMLHALEERGIYVSAGSACSSHKKAVSSVLKAIGLTGDSLESTLRFSFSYDNTEEQVQYAVDTIGELLPTLRKYVRK